MERTGNKQELFETMPVPRALATLAIPTIISQLINLIYNLVDTFWIGRTGNSYMMAGITVSFTIFMLNISFGNLFGIGGGSLMARLNGRHQYENAKHVCAYSFYWSIAVSVLYSLLILLTMEPLLYALGASAATIGYAKQYVMFVVVLGTLPLVLSMSTAHLLRNVGYAKQASMGLSAGGILNMILDPIFMFVLMPEGYEVMGAAIATLLSNVCSCIYLVYQLYQTSKTASVSLRIGDARRIEREEIRELFSVGIPSAILTALFDVGNLFLNLLTAAHGDLQLAAIGIVMKIDRLPNAVNIGICQGMLPLVAYNFSSGNHDRMQETIRTSRRYGLIIAFACMALFEVFAPGVVHIFLRTNGANGAAAVATLAFAALFIRIRCLASPFQYLNYSTSYCMQGIGDGRDTMIHACARQLVFYIPLMYLLDGLFGMTGLVAAMPIGELLGALLALYLLKRYLARVQSRKSK